MSFFSLSYRSIDLSLHYLYVCVCVVSQSLCWLICAAQISIDSGHKWLIEFISHLAFIFFVAQNSDSCEIFRSQLIRIGVRARPRHFFPCFLSFLSFRVSYWIWSLKIKKRLLHIASYEQILWNGNIFALIFVRSLLVSSRSSFIRFSFPWNALGCKSCNFREKSCDCANSTNSSRSLSLSHKYCLTPCHHTLARIHFLSASLVSLRSQFF